MARTETSSAETSDIDVVSVFHFQMMIYSASHIVGPSQIDSLTGVR
jgi:hypothetical protein